MKNLNVLIIDDEIKLTRSLAFTLRQAGMECLFSHNGTDGCRIAERERPDVILLDIRMPGLDGLEVLEWLQAELPDIPVLMMSAFDDTKDAVTAIKRGAVDYVAKPFDVDELILLIHETCKRTKREAEIRYLRERHTNSAEFIGNSQPIKALRDSITRVVDARVKTVLLNGETGVGKAVIARQLHVQSCGEDAPFVELNCATLPEEKIEAELFGAEKGALPGLLSRRRGFVEIADGGTLFLDEVNEMPLAVQAKLLTFLETRSYRPVGMTREHNADVLVIAATNTRLKDNVKTGEFRQDLFFRLNVMPLEIPPLRARDGDIELLANFFAQAIAKESATRPIALSRSALDFLANYPWPGNIRELKNLVERLTILHSGHIVGPEHLPAEVTAQKPSGPVSIEESMENVERKMIQDALHKSGGKKGIAADRLGISRHALKRKLQRLGMQ